MPFNLAHSGLAIDLPLAAICLGLAVHCIREALSEALSERRAK